MLKHLSIIAVLLLGSSAFAAETSTKASPVANDNQAVNYQFVEGKHYKKLANPLPDLGAPVAEFFYFGCKACYQLIPDIANWSYTNKIDVTLIPVHSETAMVDAARMFHTFDQMGVIGQMYELGYVMFQTENKNLQGEARVNSFLDRHKVDKDKFWAVWKSETVSKHLKDSARLTKQAEILKTPSFVVHGLYKVDVESLKSVDELYALLSYLLKKKPAAPAAPALLKKPV